MDSRDLFEILVREHADMLLGFLRCAVREAALVDDLFQETMLVAWRKLDEFNRRRPFGPWLRGIASRLVLAARRRRSREVYYCDELLLERVSAKFDALAARPGDTWDEKLSCLRDCLGQLPRAYGEAIELRYQEDLSAAEVAQRLAISPETAKKRLQRGRQRLAECLNRKLPVDAS